MYAFDETASRNWPLAFVSRAGKHSMATDPFLDRRLSVWLGPPQKRLLQYHAAPGCSVNGSEIQGQNEWPTYRSAWSVL